MDNFLFQKGNQRAFATSLFFLPQRVQSSLKREAEENTSSGYSVAAHVNQSLNFLRIDAFYIEFGLLSQ